MGKIRIVTDSTADLSREQVDKYGITVVPISVLFGTESYADGVDLGAEEFYRRLESSEVMPKTSQPSPEAFRRVYEEIGSSGDSILSIHISGKLSGTINSAEIASKMVSTEVKLVDTLNASQGIARTVLTAAEAIERGFPLEKVLEIAEKSVSETFSVFAVDTLEYLRRNGRIGKAQSLLGSMLQIKPILYADSEGMVAPYDKVRGRSKIVPTLAAAALKKIEPGRAVNLSVVHSGATESAARLRDELSGHYEVEDFHLGMVGPAIGTNIGPGAVGLMIQPSFDHLAGN